MLLCTKACRACATTITLSLYIKREGIRALARIDWKWVFVWWVDAVKDVVVVCACASAYAFGRGGKSSRIAHVRRESPSRIQCEKIGSREVGRVHKTANGTLPTYYRAGFWGISNHINTFVGLSVKSVLSQTFLRYNTFSSCSYKP